MITLTRDAKAKINLTMEILGKRPDGYHETRSVMHKIGLCDRITAVIGEPGSRNDENAGRIRVLCTPEVCLEADNLAYKAANLFAETYYKKTRGVFSADITIEKHIPEQAGLAGGSADAACTLDIMQEALGVLSDEEIDSLCADLGADVPFMRGKHGCALATGIGTDLRALPMLPVCYAVLAKPDAGLSTKEIYEAFDSQAASAPKVKVNSLIAGLEQEDFVQVCGNIANQFEPVCVKKLPVIGQIKQELQKSGAYAAQMTGSGSAVFGLFGTEDAAARAAEPLCALIGKEHVFVCRV